MPISELEVLFEKSPAARACLGCTDPACCKSIATLLREPEAHNLTEQRNALEALSSIPNQSRASHFLDKTLRTAQSKAERVQKLTSASDKIRKMSGESAIRLGRFYGALEVTADRIGNVEFAPELVSKIVKNQADRGMGEKS